MTSPRRFSPRWWVEDADGRVAVAQWPNAAISVFVATVVVRWFVPDGDRASTLLWMGRGALVVWALDELVRGSSPFRRVLGAVVLAVQLLRLVG